MATFRLPIYYALAPDTSGSVWWEPTSIKLANDLYPTATWLIYADTSTLLYAYISFMVPKNYVGTAKIVYRFAVNATSGNGSFKCNYTAIADAETFDPSSPTETPSVSTVACPGTAFLIKEGSISLTSANLAVDDTVMLAFGRDGAGADTIAAALGLVGLYFEYADI